MSDETLKLTLLPFTDQFPTATKALMDACSRRFVPPTDFTSEKLNFEYSLAFAKTGNDEWAANRVARDLFERDEFIDDGWNKPKEFVENMTYDADRRGGLQHLQWIVPGMITDYNKFDLSGLEGDDKAETFSRIKALYKTLWGASTPETMVSWLDRFLVDHYGFRPLKSPIEVEKTEYGLYKVNLQQDPVLKAAQFLIQEKMGFEGHKLAP